MRRLCRCRRDFRPPSFELLHQKVFVSARARKAGQRKGLGKDGGGHDSTARREKGAHGVKKSRRTAAASRARLPVPHLRRRRSDHARCRGASRGRGRGAHGFQEHARHSNWSKCTTAPLRRRRGPGEPSILIDFFRLDIILIYKNLYKSINLKISFLHLGISRSSLSLGCRKHPCALKTHYEQWLI